MDTKQPNALRLADALGRAPKWQQLQAAAEMRRLHAENEALRKTNTAARGTDAQIIKERELCAYAFAGAVADGLSGGTGPDTQESEWLRPAFEAGQEIAQLRAEIDKLRKRECLHKIDEPDHFRGATQMVQAGALGAVQQDAARYRFLRDGDWRETAIEPIIRLQLNALWDAKIDAARAAQGGV